jgi:hypothetical protein
MGVECNQSPTEAGALGLKTTETKGERIVWRKGHKNWNGVQELFMWGNWWVERILVRQGLCAVVDTSNEEDADSWQGKSNWRTTVIIKFLGKCAAEIFESIICHRKLIHRLCKELEEYQTKWRQYKERMYVMWGVFSGLWDNFYFGAGAIPNTQPGRRIR